MRPRKSKYWIDDLESDSKQIAITRLTALWAFVESALGGMLHLFKSPFTGLTVGGFAMLILIFISRLSNNSSAQIFKSLIIVLVIKFTLSPQTPPTAYIAVCFQALVAIVIFNLSSVNYITVMLFCVIAMLESAFQKLLVLTIVFGKQFWTSVDIFLNFISNELGFIKSVSGFAIVGLYCIIYLLGGITIGVIANKILERKQSFDSPVFNYKTEMQANIQRTKYKKFIYFFCTLLFISACFFMTTNDNKLLGIIKIITYSLLMIFAFQFVILNFLKLCLKKILSKQKVKYYEEINSILNQFPEIEKIVTHSWSNAGQIKGLNKIMYFFNSTFYQIIFVKPNASNHFQQSHT